MATEFVSFTIPNYVADWDILGKINPIGGKFSRPPALTTGAITSVLAAIGASLKSSTVKAPCSPPSSFAPRRLKFSFVSGGSLSIPFSLRSQGLALATSLKPLLVADLGPLTCIELIGEKWGRVDEDLRPVGTTVTAGVDVRVVTGSKNPIYTAAYNYVNDEGTSFIKTIKQNTDSVAVPALPFSPYIAAINGALGTKIAKGCGSSTGLTARHYTATILTTNPKNPTRSLIIPVAATASTAIRAAGIAIATIAQTMCLAYEGESDPRLSRLVP